MHRAYKHAQSRHTDGDILQQMPALAEECEADYKYDHRVHVVAKRDVQHMPVHDGPVV